MDQACPVCMGYDFALDDKWRLRELEQTQTSLYTHKHYPKESYLSVEEAQELKEEALPKNRERYELTNSRRKEMGLEPIDVDELQQEFQQNYC